MATTRLHKGGLPPAGWEFVPGNRKMIRVKVGAQASAAPARPTPRLVIVRPPSAPTRQPQNGDPGDPGEDGLSAFELARLAGFEGSLSEWLDSLKGEPGKKGDKGDDGDTPTPAQVEALVSQIAKSWLRGNIRQPQSIKGDKGDDGLSAFDLAVKGGFKGDLQAWLRSLRGGTTVITNTPLGGGGFGNTGGGGIRTIVPGEGIEIDDTDPEAPIISATGSAQARQEVFIGEPAVLPTYPALIFTSRIVDGQAVYEMQVNIP